MFNNNQAKNEPEWCATLYKKPILDILEMDVLTKQLYRNQDVGLFTNEWQKWKQLNYSIKVRIKYISHPQSLNSDNSRSCFQELQPSRRPLTAFQQTHHYLQWELDLMAHLKIIIFSFQFRVTNHGPAHTPILVIFPCSCMGMGRQCCISWHIGDIKVSVQNIQWSPDLFLEIYQPISHKNTHLTLQSLPSDFPDQLKMCVRFWLEMKLAERQVSRNRPGEHCHTVTSWAMASLEIVDRSVKMCDSSYPLSSYLILWVIWHTAIIINLF